ncbi:MAG: YaiI/YqxD family protein [Bacteriovoracia bacterium]
MLHIYIDADGCAVKEEVYRVAERYQLSVTLVANKGMNIPQNSRTNMVVVLGTLDAADDWIAAHVNAGDIVITADIPLADRCVKKQARVLGPKGIEFTEDSVGEAMATRELMKNLREWGEMRGGPAPMEKKDKSRFLGKLDQIVQSIRRGAP